MTTYVLCATMHPLNPAVDEYIASLIQWGDEVSLLRSIVCTCDVEEELKWRQPTYTVDGAKQQATRQARAEACIPRILAGKGLNDR